MATCPSCRAGVSYHSAICPYCGFAFRAPAQAGSSWQTKDIGCFFPFALFVGIPAIIFMVFLVTRC